MVKVRRWIKLILSLFACYMIVVCIHLLLAKVPQNTVEVGKSVDKINIPAHFITHKQKFETVVIRAKEGPIVGNNSHATENTTRIHFISVSENGRLGNQMFEIATLTVSALRHGFTPVIPGHNIVKHVFEVEYIEDANITNIKVFNEVKAGTYDRRIELLTHDENWTLHGYFQSWKYFHYFRNKIKNLFKFKPKIANRAINVIRPFVVQGRPIVGVHVRRGDKAQPSHLKMGNSVATPDYMIKALNFFRKNTSRPVFVVTSDDRLWTSRYVKGPDIFFVGTESPGVDLAILSLCNHTIITVGAFGWWGAYLSGGITVYYDNYPHRNSWLATQYSYSDYYLPNWIGLE